MTPTALGFRRTVLVFVAALAAGCAGSTPPPQPKDSAKSTEKTILGPGPAVDPDDAAEAAAKSVGPRATAVPIETERTRKYLKAHRLFEVSNKTDEGVQQWKRVVVDGEGRVFQGQATFSVPAKEKIAITDERTAREVGALLTDLVQPGNSVFEAAADKLEREKRYDVVVVAMTGGARYGHSETFRWTFSLTPSGEILFHYRSPIVLPKGG